MLVLHYVVFVAVIEIPPHSTKDNGASPWSIPVVAKFKQLTRGINARGVLTNHYFLK